MAVISTINVNGTKAGGNVASEAIGPFQLVNSDAPGAHGAQSFAANTFAAILLPALIGTSAIAGIILYPPSTNAGTILLKGVTGDTGVPLHKTKPSIISLDAGATPGLTCSALTVIELDFF